MRRSLRSMSKPVTTIAAAAAAAAASSTSSVPESTKARKYWLFKSESNARMVGGVDVSFSIDALVAEPGQRCCWDGVRNHQAKNFMRYEMREGDLAFFYHSSCKTPAIVGIVRVVKEGYPDHTAFDKDDPHYDPRSDADKPRWFMVDVEFVRKLRREISLHELKTYAGGAGGAALEGMALLSRGNRLSVQPVEPKHFSFIVEHLEPLDQRKLHE